MKIYLATWILEESQGITLSKKNKKERLLSFFHTIQKIQIFRKYIKTGK